MFLGQATGAWAGGTVLADSGIARLPWFAAGGMLAALMLSQHAAARSRRTRSSDVVLNRQGSSEASADLSTTVQF
jgi:hypothetical protein